MTLEQKLTALLNSKSAENESNTPDWILAQYLIGCLEAFNRAVNKRTAWYGSEPQEVGVGTLSAGRGASDAR